ncbi:maleate cis-trans isomerase family protein [Falsiroseomonas sp. E2-1-a20]|uniref:maleate cis-trans isomerase family protein n=1 Tax=Falsiroseomonas sp. E2-1-a20 TaxID=3239300 RepID=UPI003F2BB8A4
MTWPEPRFLPTHRIGLLTPSANPAVEPELRDLLPPRVALHATRLPVMPGTTLEQRNAAYPAAMAESLRDFGDLALDAMILGITGPSYALPPAEDAALQDRLSAEAGRPVLLAARAIAQALMALGRPKLLLFSPYPGWLAERAERYWRATGVELVAGSKAPGTFRAYEMSPQEVADGLARLAPPADCTVLLSGTGMPTLDAMAWMRGRIGVPMISSNLACAFAACRALGVAPGAAMAACCPELAGQL